MAEVRGDRFPGVPGQVGWSFGSVFWLRSLTGQTRLSEISGELKEETPSMSALLSVTRGHGLKAAAQSSPSRDTSDSSSV